MELAVAPKRHGQGIGRAIVAWLIEEARRRGKTAVLVGTANSSIGNIAFYQKVGFRMDSGAKRLLPVLPRASLRKRHPDSRHARVSLRSDC
jgi:predicted N-acetyltransferase YhbS